MTGEFAIAVHAIVYLNHKRQTLSSEALAQNVCTHPARLRKVMARLKKADLIVSHEGAEGGYAFSRDADGVTLRQIADALKLRLVSTSWKSGNTDMECLIASGMADMMENIYVQLDEECKKSLQKITIADIDRKIFAEK